MFEPRLEGGRKQVLCSPKRQLSQGLPGQCKYPEAFEESRDRIELSFEKDPHGNANQNYNEVSLYTSQNGNHQKVYK